MAKRKGLPSKFCKLKFLTNLKLPILSQILLCNGLQLHQHHFNFIITLFFYLVFNKYIHKCIQNFNEGVLRRLKYTLT